MSAHQGERLQQETEGKVNAIVKWPDLRTWSKATVRREKEMNLRDTVNASNERAKLKFLLRESEWVEVPLIEWRTPKGRPLKGKERENWACRISSGRCLRGIWKHLVNTDFYIPSDKASGGADRRTKQGQDLSTQPFPHLFSSSQSSFVLEAEEAGNQVLKLVH